MISTDELSRYYMDGFTYDEACEILRVIYTNVPDLNLEYSEEYIRDYCAKRISNKEYTAIWINPQERYVVAGVSGAMYGDNQRLSFEGFMELFGISQIKDYSSDILELIVD